MNATPISKRPWLARIFISPDEARLRAGWRILGQFALMLFFLAFFACPVALWLTQNPPANTLFVADKLIGIITVTGSVFLARRLFDRRSITSLGLAVNGRGALDLLVGFLITFVMMGFIYGVEWALGWLTFEGFAWQAQPGSQVLLGTLGMLVVFIAVGWQEELLCRGCWLQNLADGMTLFWGVVISSVFFSLGHLLNPNASWNALLGLVLAGLFLAYGYLRTRQLWLSIGLHIGWNFLEGTVFGFPVSGLTDMPRLVLQSVQGPELITGGPFGPEAGLIVVPALALGAILIYSYTQKRSFSAPSSQPGKGSD